MIDNIPRRYRDASFDDVPENVKEAFEHIRSSRKGIYIHGEVGTGKTHIAYALMREWQQRRENDAKNRENMFEILESEYQEHVAECEKLKKVPLSKEAWARQQEEFAIPKTRPHAVYWGMARLLFELRNDIRKNSDTPIYEDLLKAEKLLFLDDIGAERITEWVEEVFYLIINSHYENETPIIFTSNYPLSGIAENVGERVASRIKEMSTVIQLTGGDKRLE